MVWEAERKDRSLPELFANAAGALLNRLMAFLKRTSWQSLTVRPDNIVRERGLKRHAHASSPHIHCLA